MNIITPLNDYGRLANVYIKNLRVISTEITNIADKELNSINSALLYFIVLGNFYIEKFEAYDNFGITVFTLIDFEVAEFVDVIHEWK